MILSLSLFTSFIHPMTFVNLIIVLESHFLVSLSLSFVVLFAVSFSILLSFSLVMSLSSTSFSGFMSFPYDSRHSRLTNSGFYLCRLNSLWFLFDVFSCRSFRFYNALVVCKFMSYFYIIRFRFTLVFFNIIMVFGSVVFLISVVYVDSTVVLNWFPV